MSMTPFRKHVVLAIDGGGVKGLMVARALMALEKELVGDRPLIEYPGLNILAGTSTGAILTAGLSIGMRAKDIAQLYIDAGAKVFPALVPTFLPDNVRSFLLEVIGLFRPNLYSSQPFIQIFQDVIEKYTGDKNLSMIDLGKKKLRPDQALILTTVDISERRTHFIKSYGEDELHFKLWEAMYASSAAPTVFPVYTRPDLPGYYVDGGVGAHGNPTYLAAHEATEWNRYDPKDVTLLSFGTGWVPAKNYIIENGPPSQWHVLKWAAKTPYAILEDVIRSQSLDIIDEYVHLDDFSQGLDFRRFEVLLDKAINPFAAIDANNQKMIRLGDQLGQRILNDQHALSRYPNPIDPDFDPEGLATTLKAHLQSRAEGGADQNYRH